MQRALAGLAALAVGMGIGRFAFTPILPMMQAEGLSLAAGGWLASANYAGYLAGALSARWLRGDRAIRAGLAVIAFTTLGMALEAPLGAWLVLRTAAGVASAWLLVNVAAWTLQQRAPGGVVYAGVGAGSAAAGLTCLVLMQVGLGAAEAWIALGLAAALAALVLWPAFHVRTRPTGEATALRWTPRSLRLVLEEMAFTEACLLLDDAVLDQALTEEDGHLRVVGDLAGKHLSLQGSVVHLQVIFAWKKSQGFFKSIIVQLLIGAVQHIIKFAGGALHIKCARADFGEFF